MCRLKWSRSSTFDSSGRDVACWLPQVSVSCADVHGSTNTYMVSMSKRTRQIKWMNDERTYIYKLWTRRAMQTPCLLFALWPSFFSETGCQTPFHVALSSQQSHGVTGYLPSNQRRVRQRKPKSTPCAAMRKPKR
jgi:hypothetical protein